MRSLLFTLLALSSLHAQTVYVDDDALSGGDGTTWITAFDNVQDALQVAGPGVDIWVAEGTYYADVGGTAVDDDVNATFLLKTGVKLYGGFPNGGTATVLGDRDPFANETILSGDLDQDGTETGNAESVVTGNGADATALLDGFTVSFGNSSSGTLSVGGAGLRCQGAGTEPVIRGCRFTNHRSAANGIINLYATTAPGPKIINCEITGNNARGVVCFDGIGRLENVLVANNFNSFAVVGVRLDGASDMTFTNCTIANNVNLSSNSGGSGGFYMRNTSTALIENTIIWGNTTNIPSLTTAENNFDTTDSASANFTNCLVEGRTAGSLGGVNNLNGTDPADDPLLSDPAGGNFRLSFGSPAVNAGENALSMESTDLDGNPRIVDSIVNLGPYEGLVPRADGIEVLNYDIGDGSLFSSVVSLWDTFADPMGNYTYALFNNSNAALVTPAILPNGAVDLTFSGSTRGIARLVFSAENNGQVGFYHLLVTRGDVLHVDASVAVAGSGTTWGSAYDDLQTALAAAVAGDQLWVAEGTYYPDTGTGQTPDDTDSTFLLKNGVRLYGGFDSSGLPTMVDQRDWAANPVILCGDLQQDDTAGSSASGNAFHVVTGNSLDDSVIFDGFQIQSGYADGVDAEDQDGGGMHLLNCSIEVSNCLISGCYADDDAGGLYIENGESTFTNLALSGNRAGDHGGGCAYDSTTSTFTNVTAAGNYSQNDGGAFYRASSTISPKPTMINGLVWNNMTGDNTEISFGDSSQTFAVVRHSLVEEINFSLFSGFTGMGNLDGKGSVVPVFLFSSDPSIAPQIFSDLRLDARSTLGADLGEPGSNTMGFDLAHAARVSGSEIDLGAYEGILAAAYPGQPSYSITFASSLGTSVVNAFDLSSDLTNPGGAITYDLLSNGDPSFVTGVTVNPSTGQVDLTFSGNGTTTLVFRADNGQGPGYITLVVNRETVLYVDEDVAVAGAGDSWTNAFATLQDALAVATAPTQIWVAEGRYQPDQGGGNTLADRNASFVVPSGVSLIGGFEAGDSSLSDRNADDHPVILSGDLLNDDDPDAGLTSYVDNSFRVVDCDNPLSEPATPVNGILLDSLIISDGCGFFGAAIYAKDRHLEIVDCKILDNSFTAANAPFFASVIIEGGANFFSGTEISNNRLLLETLPAGPGDQVFGAAGLALLGGSLHLYDCQFLGNIGTLPDHISYPETVSGVPGTVGHVGYMTSGALMMFADPGDLQTLTNCELRGNQGHRAGAIFGEGSLALTNSLVSGNRALGVDGPVEGIGAIRLESPGGTIILNSTITANRSVFGGTILSFGDVEIVNSAILNNLTESNDGGNIVFYPLTATFLEGEGSTYTISTSYVEGASGQGSLTSDFPAFQSFINPGYPIAAPHQDGSYRALFGSNGEGTTGRLNDEGDDADYAFWLSQIRSEVMASGFSLPATITDLRGNDRIINAGIEIGAYEGETSAVFILTHPNVDPDADESGNGFTNFYQFAAGYELTATEIPGLEIDVIDSGGFSYLFTHRQRANVGDLVSSILVSPDLTTPFTTLGGVTVDNLYVRTSAGLIPFSSSVSIPEGEYVLGNDLVIEKSHDVGNILPPRNFFQLQSQQPPPGP